MDTQELRDLLPSWELALEADDKSPNTLAMYRAGVRAWLDYCDDQALEPLTRESLRRFAVAMREAGRRPGTVRARWSAARRYVKWLHAEDEIAEDPFTGLAPPKDAEGERKPFSPEELRAMFGACETTKGATDADRFCGRRDAAMLRVLAETGMRAHELLSLTVPTEAEQRERVFRIVGKGRSRRSVTYGPKTAQALDRYLRIRRRHPHAEDPELWLAWQRPGGLSYNGLAFTLKARAQAAGVAGFHLHRLRHTFADRWLAAGGSERDLMTVAGWKRHEQLAVYTKGRATERALTEARRLNLGEL